jgi:hypothetical protein
MRLTHLVILIGQHMAALGRTLFVPDPEPPLALASVLPSARVFGSCTKALALAAIDTGTSDFNSSGAFAGVRNDPASDEQERHRGRNRLRLGVHCQIVPPNGVADPGAAPGLRSLKRRLVN